MPQRHSDAKLAHFKSKCQQLSAENRQLKQRLKEVSASRALKKDKYKRLQVSSSVAKRLCVRVQGQGERDAIKGHKYSSTLVSLCLSLYIIAGCSFRGVSRVLGCLQSEYGVIKGAIPSKSSIENWVQKLGYYQYTHYGSDLYAGDYCLIVDECMVIGQERFKDLILFVGVFNTFRYFVSNITNTR